MIMPFLLLCLLQTASPATQATAQDWDALADKLYQALRYNDLETFNVFLKKADADLVSDFHKLRFKPRGEFIGGNLLRAVVHCRANRIGSHVVTAIRTKEGKERLVSDYLNHIDDQDGMTFLGWLSVRAQSRLGTTSPHELDELRQDVVVLQSFRNMGAKVECELDANFECTEDFDPWLTFVVEDLRAQIK